MIRLAQPGDPNDPVSGPLLLLAAITLAAFLGAVYLMIRDWHNDRRR